MSQSHGQERLKSFSYGKENIYCVLFTINTNDQESCGPELPCEDSSGQHHPDPGAKDDSWANPASLYGAADNPGSSRLSI